jgi:hypothetical protein
MANVPMYDVVFFFAVEPAFGVVGAVLFVVVFRALRRMRRTVNETHGLYQVVLDHVLETYEPSAAAQGEPSTSDDSDDAPS